MVKTAQKLTLSPYRDIPCDQIVLSQANFRRIKTGISLQELAEDIARRGLLQSPSVPPVMAEYSSETDKFVIPAGGRHFQALSLHPLDQFRVFVALRAKGQGDEEIAAAVFLTPQVVKQRLKRAAVAPALLEF